MRRPELTEFDTRDPERARAQIEQAYASHHFAVTDDDWPAIALLDATGFGWTADPDEFTDVFCGTWLSFRAYAEDLADSTGMMADWPETARSYFNWDSWTRDQRHDYTVVDADGGEVHVFRSL